MTEREILKNIICSTRTTTEQKIDEILARESELVERARKPLQEFMDGKCKSGIGVMIAVKETLSILDEIKKG